MANIISNTKIDVSLPVRDPTRDVVWQSIKRFLLLARVGARARGATNGRLNSEYQTVNLNFPLSVLEQPVFAIARACARARGAT